MGTTPRRVDQQALEGVPRDLRPRLREPRRPARRTPHTDDRRRFGGEYPDRCLAKRSRGQDGRGHRSPSRGGLPPSAGSARAPPGGGRTASATRVVGFRTRGASTQEPPTHTREAHPHRCGGQPRCGPREPGAGGRLHGGMARAGRRSRQAVRGPERGAGGHGGRRRPAAADRRSGDRRRRRLTAGRAGAASAGPDGPSARRASACGIGLRWTSTYCCNAGAKTRQESSLPRHSERAFSLPCGRSSINPRNREALLQTFSRAES